MNKRIIAGAQPSNQLHLGNYLAMLKNLANLDKSNLFVFSADLHSLSMGRLDYDRNFDILRMMMASLGTEANYYIQSSFPEICYLYWLLNPFSYVGELERMTQFKEKGAGNAALFNYPILMAADILAINADLVLAGADQKQHIELCRSIAERVNKSHGNIFNIPNMQMEKPLRIKDLRDPSKKMSKSGAAKGVIFLSDSPKDIENKISAAVTDSFPMSSDFVDGRNGVNNLALIYKEVSGEDPFIFAGGSLGDFKRELKSVIVPFLMDIQDKGSKISKEDIKIVLDQKKDFIGSIMRKNIRNLSNALGIDID